MKPRRAVSPPSPEEVKRAITEFFRGSRMEPGGRVVLRDGRTIPTAREEFARRGIGEGAGL
jgi:hypothetical protein